MNFERADGWYWKTRTKINKMELRGYVLNPRLLDRASPGRPRKNGTLLILYPLILG